MAGVCTKFLGVYQFRLKSVPHEIFGIALVPWYLGCVPPADAAAIERPGSKKRSGAAVLPEPPVLQLVHPPPTGAGRTNREADLTVGAEIELAYTDTVIGLGLVGFRGRVLAHEKRSVKVEMLVDRGNGFRVEHHQLVPRDVYLVDI